MNISTQIKQKREEFQELEQQLASPEVVSDPAKLKTVSRTYNQLKTLLEVADRFESSTTQLTEAKALVDESDAEMKAMAEQEVTELEAKIPELESQLMRLLVPRDPDDEKNVIMEIRAGTGGDEAALFATDLYRMYVRFAEQHGWKTEILTSSQNDLGGFKSVEFSIAGDGAYGLLKFEGGVHRVQRIPETEKSGRIHTSTATVAVLPEIEETESEIDPKDLEIEATTSTGAGGQSVNTTYSAIRVTHIPTGIMVYCQDERSQKQNKERALKIIRARVHEMERERQIKERGDDRRGQIGTGERSEKIRTYNFPQDRVTDHRIQQNFHNIPNMLDGGLQNIVDALQARATEEALNQAE